MKRAAIIAVTAAALAMSTASAFAWSDVTGKISSVDSKMHKIVLDNGKTYMIEKKVAIASLKPGDTVTLSTERKNGENLVNQVTPSS